MLIITAILNWLKNKINYRFADHESMERFFRTEYGRDADIAYHQWATTRRILNRVD